jgi:hypothetical protein
VAYAWRSAHTRALGAPQSFPLTGDGAETAVITSASVWRCDPIVPDLAVKLAEARYRDWLIIRGHRK